MPRTVRANIRLLATGDGGRRSPIASGCLSNIRIDGRYTDARVDLVGRETLAPGAACEAILTFALDQPDDIIRIGTTFDLTEGGRKVGAGVIDP